MEREGDEPRVSRGQDEDAGKTKSPLKMAKVNSLLLPVSQHHAQARSRLTRKSELDYDKENDIGEGEVEDSIIERADIRESLFRQSPGSEDGRQFMGFRDAGSETNGGRVSESEPEPESEPESGSEDNGFDSMDDFIVSDDEELSVHGTSEAETDHDEIQSSPLPPPLPPSPPKRRLFRGRRRDPKAEVENELESPSQKEEELPRLEQSRPDLTMPSLVSDLLPKEVSQDELNIDQEMERLSLENNDVSSQLERDLYQ